MNISLFQLNWNWKWIFDFVNQILIKFNKGFWGCNVWVIKPREIVRCCLRCACLQARAGAQLLAIPAPVGEKNFALLIYRMVYVFLKYIWLVEFSFSINQKCEKVSPTGAGIAKSCAPKTTPNNFPRLDNSNITTPKPLIEFN